MEERRATEGGGRPQRDGPTLGLTLTVLLLAAAAPFFVGGPWLAVVWGGGGATLVGRRGFVQGAGLLLLMAAAARMVLWESYPDLLGGMLAPGWLRTLGYAGVAAGFVTAAVRSDRRLLVAAAAVGFWWVTFEATYAIAEEHSGRLSGNEMLLVAGVWSLYGLGVALLCRRTAQVVLRHAARGANALGLVMLVGGAMLSNGRWAEWEYRLFAYVAVLLSAWATEALLGGSNDDQDVQGLVGLAGAVAATLALAFETRLWLDTHLFSFAEGMRRSPGHLAWEVAVRTYAAAAAWGLVAAPVAGAGAWLRSPRTMVTAAGLAAVALGYLAVAGWRPGAPQALVVLSLAVVVAGGLSAWWLGRRRVSELRWAPLAVGTACAVWALGLILA